MIGKFSQREWGKYSLQAWGKRRWSASNSRAAWGKRQEADADRVNGELPVWNEAAAAADKRRWSANNGMRAWGKRSQPYVDGRPKRSVDDDEAAIGTGDRQRSRRAPVKRQWRTAGRGRYGGPKRTWEFNTMKTWGKRRAKWPEEPDRLYGSNALKRSWSSDNSLRIWGKRSLAGGNV